MCISKVRPSKFKMGNDHSNNKPKKSSAEEAVETRRTDATTDNYFRALADQQTAITYPHLVNLFGEDLAESLIKYITERSPSETECITKEEFVAKFPALYGMSTDIYVKILQPVNHFIKVCSDCAGASAVEGDEEFIKCLAQNMTSSGKDNVAAILEWRRNKCDKFCNSVQNRIVSTVTGQPQNQLDYSSDILTPLQMWFLQCSLPVVYFPSKEKEEIKHWSPLYTSLQHGISTNRFETLVFDYRGPTVTIMRLTDKRVVAIASEQEWRHSASKFGGTFTSLFELYPNISRIDKGNSIYCNLKLRSCSMGLSFNEDLKIDKDFNEVLDIEVWGCAGGNTLAEQQKLKNWQKQQTEKHKKVPLPGNWDDNPDKTLLEMAGFQFSDERKLMEMEAAKRAADEK